MNKMYFVTGGWHASTENTNRVECYNVQTDCWDFKAAMCERRYRPGELSIYRVPHLSQGYTHRPNINFWTTRELSNAIRHLEWGQSKVLFDIIEGLAPCPPKNRVKSRTLNVCQRNKRTNWAFTIRGFCL